MTEAVLLDVGGVVVMPSHDIVGPVAAAYGGAPSPAALDRGHYLGVEAGDLDAGFDWAAYRRALLAAGGVPADRVEAAQVTLAERTAGPARDVWTRVFPGAAAALAAIDATGVALGFVSNADGTVAEGLLRLGLTTPGRVVVDSGAVGVSKPDPAIFRLALDALDVDPATAVYVGDVPSVDVVGARNAGLRPLHLDPIGWCGDRSHDHVAALGEVARLVTRR